MLYLERGSSSRCRPLGRSLPGPVRCHYNDLLHSSRHSPSCANNLIASFDKVSHSIYIRDSEERITSFKDPIIPTEVTIDLFFLLPLVLQSYCTTESSDRISTSCSIKYNQIQRNVSRIAFSI